MRFQSVLSTDGLTEGWLLTAQYDVLILECVGTESRIFFEKGIFATNTLKHRSYVLSCIREILGEIDPNAKVYVDPNAERLISLIVSDNRVHF